MQTCCSRCSMRIVIQPDGSSGEADPDAAPRREGAKRRAAADGTRRRARTRGRACPENRVQDRAAGLRTTATRPSSRPWLLGRSGEDASTAPKIALEVSPNLGPGLTGISARARTGRSLFDLGRPCGFHALVGTAVQAGNQLGGELGPARRVELERFLEKLGGNLGHVPQGSADDLAQQSRGDRYGRGAPVLRRRRSTSRAGHDARSLDAQIAIRAPHLLDPELRKED